ncbi:MAG: hypothetical protein ABII72_05005 [Parcubacteria group bacterium]
MKIKIAKIALAALLICAFFFSFFYSIDFSKAKSPFTKAQEDAQGILQSKKEDWQSVRDELMKVDAECQQKEEALTKKLGEIESDAGKLREIISTLSDFTQPLNLKTEGQKLP